MTVMKNLALYAIVLGLTCLGSPRSALADLAVGDAAPDFELIGSDGETYKLSEMKGKAVVLAWFPKAFTVG
tara:strand:+ start:3154 stop:3366 length:213 start_codon:yes stop_codon:yes gene_type:complete